MISGWFPSLGSSFLRAASAKTNYQYNGTYQAGAGCAALEQITK